MKNIVIIGATSGIAKALAYYLASQKINLILSGRDIEELSIIASDLEIKYDCEAIPMLFEATDISTHSNFFENCVSKLKGVDAVLLAHGYLGTQELTQKDINEALKVIEVNYSSAVSILNLFSNYFESRKEGIICAISSVAGDRGRQSNYMYGSAKGALTIYLQGLRNRLQASNVHVLTVKPGFVDTKMTYGQKGLFLVAKPEYVAKKIFNAMMNKKNEIYVPWFWSFIMLIIRNVPEPIFKKLKL